MNMDRNYCKCVLVETLSEQRGIVSVFFQETSYHHFYIYKGIHSNEIQNFIEMGQDAKCVFHTNPKYPLLWKIRFIFKEKRSFLWIWRDFSVRVGQEEKIDGSLPENHLDTMLFCPYFMNFHFWAQKSVMIIPSKLYAGSFCSGSY